MHADSTMAVEVAVSDALFNWPYFQDLSLVGVVCHNNRSRPRASVRVAVLWTQRGFEPESGLVHLEGTLLHNRVCLGFSL